MSFIRRLVEKHARWSLLKRKLTPKQALYYKFKLLGTDKVYPRKFESHYSSLDDFLADMDKYKKYFGPDEPKKETNHGTKRQVYRDRFLQGRSSSEALSLIKDRFFQIHDNLVFDRMSQAPLKAAILSYRLIEEFNVILSTLEEDGELFAQRFIGERGNS